MFGASLGAVFEAARDAGYVVIHAVDSTDAFLLRKYLAECLDYLPQWAIEQRVAGKALHPPVLDKARLDVLVDYAAYRDSGGDVLLARQRARDLLPYVPLLQESIFEY